MTSVKNNKDRLSRERWLEEALHLLVSEDSVALTIDVLCKRLSVSRGSFYWHFKSRKEFVISLIEYWEQISTFDLREQMRSVTGGPEEQLSVLLERIVSYDYRKYELPIRHWAEKTPEAKSVLRRIEETRIREVRALFQAMGFEGDELEMRVQTCVVYYNFMDAMKFSDSNDDEAIDRQSRLRHRMLTQQ